MYKSIKIVEKSVASFPYIFSNMIKPNKNEIESKILI